MADQQPLCNLSKLPQMNSAAVLLIGTEGIPTEHLAKTLVKKVPAIKLQIRTAKALPLPGDADDSRPRIDFVVFALDLSNRHSFDVVKESLNAIDIHYFIGKACLLITEVNMNEIAVEMDRVTDLADAYDIPIFKVNFQKENDIQLFADKLLNLVRIASGLNPGVNALLVDTTRQPYQGDHSQIL